MKQLTLFDEAIEIALQHAIISPSVTVPTVQAMGRTLAGDALAAIDVPPFDRAMMDGFAVRSEDVMQAGVRLNIVGLVGAGSSSPTFVASGQAVRIMTGAPLPIGADAVARFEWCDIEGASVHILRAVASEESVQLRGQDGQAGAVLMPAGTRITGTEWAVLQAFGVPAVAVVARPRVAILITGSELIPTLDTPLQTGQIYGSNHILLETAVVEDGAEVVSIEFVDDDPKHLHDALQRAIQTADYVLTTGGVSVGDFDYVPHVLHALGARVAVEKVLMRPGSPFLVASAGKATVFAMSGNPAACFAQFTSFVRPAIRKSLGLSTRVFPSSGLLVNDVALKSIKHVRVLRAHADIVDGVVQVNVGLAQSPGVMSSFVHANCLIRLDEDEVPAGTVVPLQWLRMP